MKWFLKILDEFRRHTAHALALLGAWVKPSPTPAGRLHQLSGLVSALVILGAVVLVSRAPARLYVPPPEDWAMTEQSQAHLPDPMPDLTQPVREIPNRFPARTRRPTQRETDSSIGIGKVPFRPERDLVEVYDDRVFWESDHDRGDTEDDHLVHAALEIPLRRLIELVAQAGGSLEVHDAYRDVGIHAPLSLHKEGRAVDLTCDDLGLEELGKLTWAAGFDWVFYEAPRGGGHHIHASVRPRQDSGTP